MCSREKSEAAPDFLVAGRSNDDLDGSDRHIFDASARGPSNRGNRRAACKLRWRTQESRTAGAGWNSIRPRLFLARPRRRLVLLVEILELVLRLAEVLLRLPLQLVQLSFCVLAPIVGD